MGAPSRSTFDELVLAGGAFDFHRIVYGGGMETTAASIDPTSPHVSALCQRMGMQAVAVGVGLGDLGCGVY